MNYKLLRSPTQSYEFVYLRAARVFVDFYILRQFWSVFTFMNVEI